MEIIRKFLKPSISTPRLNERTLDSTYDLTDLIIKLFQPSLYVYAMAYLGKILIDMIFNKINEFFMISINKIVVPVSQLLVKIFLKQYLLCFRDLSVLWCRNNFRFREHSQITLTNKRRRRSGQSNYYINLHSKLFNKAKGVGVKMSKYCQRSL